MNEKLDEEKLYNLYKTHSSKANKEISKKINTFKNNMNFLEFYSNKDIKNLLNIFELKLSENDDGFFSSFKSDIDQYISCMSQIILSVKIYLKTQNLLKKIVINAKNHLSKLKYKNQLKNYNQHHLISYLESLFKISKKNHKLYSSSPKLLSRRISSMETNPKNFSHQKFSSDNKLDFSSGETESTIYNKTPRFESESYEELENQEQKNTNLENSIENNFLIKKNSIFTLSEYVFDEEPLTPKNSQSKLIESRINIQKKKNTFTTIRKMKTENFDKLKNVRKVLDEANFIVENNKKSQCRDILEMINDIYKKGLINSEEKVKLKQLVIEKSKKIEFLYDNIYKNAKDDKTKLISEVKKLVN